MGRDEQKEEREVLDSIFPEEIVDESESVYRVSINVEVPSIDENDAPPPTLVLRVSYPDEYPDVAPDLDLSFPPDAPKHPQLDIQRDKSHLLSSLQPTVEENLGMPMVFTLITTLQESVESLIQERRQAIRIEQEAEIAKAEEQENLKFQGEAVTRESFLAWREKFRAEMEEERRRKEEEKELEDLKKRRPKEEKRPTGRQLWEQGLSGTFEEEDGAIDEDGLVEKVQNTTVEE